MRLHNYILHKDRGTTEEPLNPDPGRTCLFFIFTARTTSSAFLTRRTGCSASSAMICAVCSLASCYLRLALIKQTWTASAQG